MSEPAPRARLYALYGLPDRPNPCRCGQDDAFVDARNRQGMKGPFFVSCAHCEATGPERSTYDLALAAWNRANPL